MYPPDSSQICLDISNSDSGSCDSITEGCLIPTKPLSLNHLDSLETDGNPKYAICSSLFVEQEDWFTPDPFETRFQFPNANQNELIIWLAQKRLIANQSFCNKCQVKPMVLDFVLTYCDNYFWRCNSCKKRKTIREKSLFSKSDLPLRVQMNILYMWALNYTISDILRIAMSNKATVFKWLDEIYDVCSWAVQNTCDRLKYDVTLKESLILSDQSLRVLAGFEESSDHRFFMVHLPKNINAQYLENLLRSYLEPQSITGLINCNLLNRFPDVVKYHKSSSFSTENTAQSDELNKLLQDFTDHIRHMDKFHCERFPLLLNEFVWRRQCGDKQFASICYALACMSRVS